MFRYRCGFQNLTAGHCHFHMQALIIDLAVFCGKNADTIVSKETTQCRASQRTGIMHQRVTSFICIPFQLRKVDTCFRCNTHGFFIQFNDFVHAFHIQQDTALYCQCTTLRACTAAPREYGDFIIISDHENSCYFLVTARIYNKICHGHHSATIFPKSGEPEVVNTVADLVTFCYRNIVSANYVFQFGTNHVKHKIIHNNLLSK